MDLIRIKGLAQAQEALAARRHLDLNSLAEEEASRSLELFGKRMTVGEVVSRILDDVRREGDAAVLRYTRLFDGVEPPSLEVPWEDVERAAVSADLMEALELAVSRIREFHSDMLPEERMDPATGLGFRIAPISTVGAYTPASTVTYPSTTLMTTIPAKVAGVENVVLATPFRRGQSPDPSILVAARLAGVDRVLWMGGAQAIAALAFGTETVPRVDMICGPGSIFVTLAKKMLFGEVGIDGLYGPTETMIIADEFADPALCAADLLAQAEHDPLASAIFVTTSEEMAGQVEKELETQLVNLERKEVAGAAMERGARLIIVENVEEAIDLANLYAPEHLCLLVQGPWAWTDKVRHAGGIFLGETSPEVLGDYVAGPSHVMPTGGTARFTSALGVHQFIKYIPIIGLDAHSLRRLGPAAARIANAEGLSAHSRAIEMRLERLKEAD